MSPWLCVHCYRFTHTVLVLLWAWCAMLWKSLKRFASHVKSYQTVCSVRGTRKHTVMLSQQHTSRKCTHIMRSLFFYQLKARVADKDRMKREREKDREREEKKRCHRPLQSPRTAIRPRHIKHLSRDAHKIQMRFVKRERWGVDGGRNDQTTSCSLVGRHLKAQQWEIPHNKK